MELDVQHYNIYRKKNQNSGRTKSKIINKNTRTTKHSDTKAHILCYILFADGIRQIIQGRGLS
jgi:hypothetical protein